jgi:pimeloyl-ACP methyl ester carboxylesterase
MYRTASRLIGLALVSWAVIAAAQPTSRDRGRFFHSGGVQIHYTDQGAGEPVVVVHGYAMNVTRMESAGLVAGLLKAGYRVLGVDCRGHGESDKPHDPAQYGPEMARDIVRLLDHLKIAKAHLVGYSMGAIISNKVRELYPERLQSVVLGGGGWHQRGAPALADLTGSDIAEAVDRTGSFEWMLRKFSEKQVPPPTDEEIRVRNQRMVEGNDLKALAAVMRAWDGFAVSEASLRENPVPTRAIVGEIDPLKAQVNALARLMRNLDVVVIPGADHGALSNPQFAPDVIEFLRRHPVKVGTASGSEPRSLAIQSATARRIAPRIGSRVSLARR